MDNNITLPNPNVRNHICEGIKYSEEMLNCIECISNMYQKHLSDSKKLGHLCEIDISLTYTCKKLYEYKKRYEKYLEEYDEIFIKK